MKYKIDQKDKNKSEGSYTHVKTVSKQNSNALNDIDGN